ncbi:MAG: hypothetical protein AB8B91_25715 [Rubripirellula sp.]
MAKKKPVKVNKSQEIRDYKRSNPSQRPKQIATALSKKGIDVSAQFVSTILSTSKKKKTIRKPGRPKGTTNASRARGTKGPGRPPKANAAQQGVSLESLLKVKEIVSEMGGLAEARSALSALEQLMD